MSTPSIAGTQHSGHRRQYVPALDGIRGLAVAAVLFFHGGALTGGYLGVDAFFVLSGFLITSLLLAEHGKAHRIDLGAFWTRRARRLLPALFVTLLAVALFAAMLASSDELARIRSDSLATLGYVANWHSIFQGHGYWTLFQAPSPLEHTWSLAIEEQFYLLWPLVFFVVAGLSTRRARRRNRDASVAPSIFGVATLFAAASAFLMVYLYDPRDPSRVYFGTDTRIAAILIGAALAAWVAWRGTTDRVAPRVALEVTGIVAAVVLAIAWFSVDGQSSTLYQGGFLVFGLATAAVIAAASHPREGPLARLLSLRPLRALGIISYGVYLWHWPIYVAMSEERTGLAGDALLAARIGASVAVATLSFFLVERPIREGSLRGRRLVFSAGAAATACVVALLAATIGATNPATIPTEAFVSKTGSHSSAVDAKRTVPVGVPTGSTPRVLVLGDSVGDSIGRAAEGLQQQFGYSVRAAAEACVFTTGVDGYRATLRDRTDVVNTYTPCEPHWREEVQTFAPQTVVVVVGTGSAFLQPSLGGQWVDPCDPRYASWYRLRLESMFKEFAQQHAVVRIAKLPYPLADYLPDDANARIDCVNAVTAQVARDLGNVSLLDLTKDVCPGGQCPDQINGQKFRPDGTHFEGQSAQYVADWILKDIQRTEEFSPPRVLLVGDSVAGGVVNASAVAQQDAGVMVGDATSAGCMLSPVDGARGLNKYDQATDLQTKPCEPTWFTSFRQFRPDTVVIVYGSASSFTQLSIGGQWGWACDAPYDQWYEARLASIVRQFAKDGTHVAIAKLPHLDGNWLPQGSDARIDCINALHERIAREVPGTQIVDLAGFVCPGGACQKEIAGDLFRPDGMHFSPAAADSVARWLLKETATLHPSGLVARLRLSSEPSGKATGKV